MAELTPEQYQAAMDVAHSNVFAPAFFNKLASAYGIQPRNEREAVQLLEMAEHLVTLEQVNNVKQANDQADVYAYYNEQLANALGTPKQASAQAGYANQLSNFAVELMQDTQIKTAAVTLSQVLAAAQGN